MVYLLILVALLACMALIDARFKLFVFARPVAAIAVLVLGTAFFLSWDLWAIAGGIFLHRESSLMTGVMLAPSLPLEEAFFLLFLSYQTMVLFTAAIRLLHSKPWRKAGVRE